MSPRAELGDVVRFKLTRRMEGGEVVKSNLKTVWVRSGSMVIKRKRRRDLGER